jgi:hypothetical protein
VKYASSIAMLFIMVLAGSALWASCGCAVPTTTTYVAPVTTCPCPAPPVMTQTLCPTNTCPQVCPPPPCPNACCGAAVPGAVGAGPAPCLQALQCPDFDPAYARSIIEQNNVIIAVAEVGMRQATDRNLRNLSGDIRQRLINANNKIVERYNICPPLPCDTARAQAIIAGLGAQCECFDMAYAKTLSELLKQSNAANTLAAQRAVDPTLQRQGGFMAAHEADWSFRLDRWVAGGGCAPVC